MKRVFNLLVFSIYLSNIFIVDAQAASTPIPTVAVIDVGVNTNLFSNIVAEVCILESLNCQNGKKFMVGPGAAYVGSSQLRDVNHGTNMVSIINNVNPNIGIIPIKIAATTNQGNLSIYTNNAVKQSLDWVYTNRLKYNIVAVSLSQGKIFNGCYVPVGTAEIVKSLKEVNIPVIASAGNDGNKNSMFSIACLSDVISIGATDNPDPGITKQAYCLNCTPSIAKYSNGNPTFYLNGRWFVTQTDGTTKFMTGTSTATASFAAWWTLKYKDSYSKTMEDLISKSIGITGFGKVGKYIDIQKV